MSRISIYLLLFCILSVFPTAGFSDFMLVSLLGTGSPRMEPDRSGPAVLVEAGGKFLLFDAGRGVVQRLAQLDMPITELNQVFLTHLHSDHISALDDLVAYWVDIPAFTASCGVRSRWNKGLCSGIAKSVRL